MRVFSYVVAHDAGFAPNPFHGWCTLACCKPRIRSRAAPGDLVVGMTRRCERIVFITQVDEAMSFAEYWSDARFRAKRPKWTAARVRDRCGDNIYRPVDGGYEQLPSAHWDHENDRESLRAKLHDTGVDRVLAGRDFVYYGALGPKLPPYLGFLSIARGHRSRLEPEQIDAVRRFFRSAPRGIQGCPTKWPEKDTSWRPGCA
jgi:hypothetical protein